MFTSYLHRAFATASVLLLATTVPAGVAAAEPPEKTPVYVEYGPEISFCGEPFIQQGFVEGWSVMRTRGGVTYTSERTTGTDTWTNALTRERVLVETRASNKTLRVTDNGDGTYTVVVQNVGTNVASTDDGKVLGRSTGLFRFALTFDNGGTPGDEEDDEVVGFETLLRAGRTMDLCAVLEQEIG